MGETLAELKNILLTGNPGTTNINGVPLEQRIKDLRDALKPKK